MGFRTALAALAFAVVATAQDTRAICGWEAIRGGVVRGSLYLEGGLQQLGTWNNGKWDSCAVYKPSYGSLFKLNFSTPFDVRSTNLRSLFQQINETTDANAPIYVDGTMVADDDEFYTIGGRAYLSADSNPLHGEVYSAIYPPNDAITGFRPSLNPTSDKVPSNVTQYIAYGAGVSIPSENLGFYFSGLASSNNSRISFTTSPGRYDFPGRLVDTMMRIDTTRATEAGFTQSSISSRTPRAGASMAWIPTGGRGLLVVIGGIRYPASIWGVGLNDTQKAANANGAAYISTVQVFDVANSLWYAQNTTGSATPPVFAQACVLVASAPDFSSHQIFVYGGWDGTSTTVSDDVWILSVPAFKWVKAATGTAGHARYAHTCAKPYPNQMIVVGGVTPYGAGLKTQNIVDVFDLNSLTWTGVYDPTKWSEYKVPKIVSDVIGGTADGGSTDVAASLNPALRSLFGTKYGKNITNWYPYVAVPTSGSSKKSVAGPVAGGVVGGLLVLAAAAAIIWFCCCSASARKKRSQKGSDDSIRHSNNFVSRWINHSAQYPPPPPKSPISSNATEIGESFSPRAEVPAGFSYFSPRARPSGVPAEMDSTPMQNHNESNIPYSRATSPGSPGSYGSAELEAPTTPPPMTQMRSAGNRNNDVFRSHPLHVPSIDAQSVSSNARSGRYVNARGPSETTSDAIELPQNRSNEHLVLPPTRPDLNRLRSEKSQTETSTDISAPTDTDGDVVETAQRISGVTQGSQRAQIVTITSYPSTTIANVAAQPNSAHHRPTSGTSSGIPIPLSPTHSSTSRPISPEEEERRSTHINNLPERLSQTNQGPAANGSSN